MFRATTVIFVAIAIAAAATIRAQVPDDVRRKFGEPTKSIDANTQPANPESSSDRLHQAQETDARLAAELPDVDKDWTARKAQLVAVLRAAATQPTTQPGMNPELKPREAPMQQVVQAIPVDPRAISRDSAVAILADLRAAATRLADRIQSTRERTVSIDPAVQARWHQVQVLLREIRDIESLQQSEGPAQMRRQEEVRHAPR